MSKGYYDEVGEYYDKDAVDFEKRYWKNDALQRIRQSFREQVRQYEFTSALEVGFGPGFDLIHFAKTHPQARVYGIDISAEMVRLAQDKIDRGALGNASVACGSVEHVESLFPEVKYDLIYVFFGALNTVENLKEAMKELERLLLPGGHMVLTFVNKWYVGGMLIEMLKGKPKWAFARLNKVWGGYSPTQFLASRCYTNREIKSTSTLACVDQRGYSILFPAWYYHKIHRLLPNKVRMFLWRMDGIISRTLVGTLGEYMLYDFRK
jgi:ubiquinone/menaquinone biosynthesis C-methylase UbiE